MDRCEACPLFEKVSETENGCGGGLPISVCIAKLQHGIFRLMKSQKPLFRRSDDHELETSKGSAT